MTVGLAINLLVVVSVLTGVPVTIRALRSVRSIAPSARTDHTPAASKAARKSGPATWRRSLIGQLRRSPGWWLAVVIAAVYANQLLFTAYVIRIHHGDPRFIARYLPPGWFDLADGGAMRTLAALVPAPDLLSPSVLRVQATLELPLVVLAYLCACRWLEPALQRALTRPSVLRAACAAYSVVFGLVEWSLPNPYTAQDLLLRAVSGVLTPLLIARWIGGGDEAPDDAGSPRSALDVLLAVVSAAALGALILLVYDTALLYNLGHVPARLPVAVPALVVLAAARLLVRRRAALRRQATVPAPRHATDTVHAGLAWFAALFFIPALPIRYALDLATAQVAITAGTVVAAAALALALRDGYARLGREPDALDIACWLGQLTAAVLAGTLAAASALLPPPSYPEVRILLAAALVLSVAIAVCGGTDALLARRAKGL